MTAREAGPVRMMMTLGIAGLCSGLAVVSVYLGTRERIERNRAEALEAAIFRVLEGATSRVAFVVQDGELSPWQSPEGSVGLPKQEAIYAGYDSSGRLLGFAIPAAGPGFQDTIGLIYGYDAERRRVVGLEVLESRETPGLGDKIIKDASFLANFRDLAVDPEIAVVKRGRSRQNEVDAISGATISSNAVVRILNVSHRRWREPLDALDAEAPALATPAAGRRGAD